MRARRRCYSYRVLREWRWPYLKPEQGFRNALLDFITLRTFLFCLQGAICLVNLCPSLLILNSIASSAAFSFLFSLHFCVSTLVNFNVLICFTDVLQTILKVLNSEGTEEAIILAASHYPLMYIPVLPHYKLIHSVQQESVVEM